MQIRKEIKEGTRFVKWVVIKEAPLRKNKTNNKHMRFYECLCDCGVYRDVRMYDLLNGKSTNCGCIKREKIVKRNYKHGFPRDRYYLTWARIKSRCYDLKNKDYYNYGGRGIILSDEWLHDYPSFREYVLSLDGFDNADLSIDRIDTNGNYERGNLRWATSELQARNRRKPFNNTSGFKGVSFNRGKFIAYISLNGKHKEIGSFNTAIEAHNARKQAIIDYNLTGYYKGE